MQRRAFLKIIPFVLLFLVVACRIEPACEQVLLRLPTVRQATNYTCGVAALQSVLRYYGTDIREDNLAKELKSNPDNGTNYRDIEAYALKKGYTVEIRTEMSLEDLQHLLRDGKPVLCAIQAWPDAPPVDWKNDWIDGHWVVAIGYDRNRMLFMDPSTLGNYTYIPNEEFIDRWHDVEGDYTTTLEHFGMAISKPVPAYDPDEILRLE